MANGLDAKRYSEYNRDSYVTWETCELREWLNDTFYQEAFSEEEKQRIKETDVINEDTDYYGSWFDAGNDTIDKVFLLSFSEANNLFTDDYSRVCYPTAYAKAQGSQIQETEGSCWWWLRSPGTSRGKSTAFVGDYGQVSEGGIIPYTNRYTVRPVIWINVED